MTNPDDEMRAALAKMGRAVLNSWDKKDQEIQRLQRENARLLAKHEPWWNCTHKWQTFATLTGPDHGCQCLKCGVHKGWWEKNGRPTVEPKATQYFVYMPCERHKGMTFTGQATYQPPIPALCPGCEAEKKVATMKSGESR